MYRYAPHAPRSPRRHRWRGLDGVRARRGRRGGLPADLHAQRARLGGEAPRGRRGRRRSGARRGGRGKPVAAHSSYLINCAAPDRDIRTKSWDALADELGRCERLGIPALIFHPGSHEDEAEGIRLVGEAMTRALDEVPGKARLLVETTAGQGACLGWRFEQVAAIRDAVPAKARRRDRGLRRHLPRLLGRATTSPPTTATTRTIEELDDVVGLGNVRAFHLNDSKKPLGCRVDRHEHIGEGTIGLAAVPPPRERPPVRGSARGSSRRSPASRRTSRSSAASCADEVQRPHAPAPEKSPPASRGAPRARRADGALPAPRPSRRKAKLDRLIEYARSHKRALILTHDNPDPDSIAAGVALAHLLEKLAGVEAMVAYGGIVGRAENRALVRVLKLPVVPVSRVVFDDYDLICMVDTQPEQGNHSLPARHFPDVVIDHHPERPDSHLAPIADVGGRHRRHLDACSPSTSARAASRCRRRSRPRSSTASRRTPATSGRQTTKQDVDAYLWLFPMVDKDALGRDRAPEAARPTTSASTTWRSRRRTSTTTRWSATSPRSTRPTWSPRWPSASVPRGHAVVARLRRVRGRALLLAPHERPAHERRPAHPRGDRGEGRLGGRPRHDGRRAAPGEGALGAAARSGCARRSCGRSSTRSA